MVDDEPPQRLTMSLIESCLCGSNSSRAAEERAADLLKAEVLRLDWQNIASIQNLDAFTNLRELYLQHNRIGVIEELDSLRNLEFLALGSNRIRLLENLRHLGKLQVLDLSNNAVEDVDTQELPLGLVIFNFAGNPGCRHPSFRQRVIASLPDLMQLDEQPVERPSPGLGMEESKGPEQGCFATPDEKQSDSRDVVTLYVTVHSGEESKKVPFSFSPAGNTAQQAECFCIENGLDGYNAKETLMRKMEEAVTGGKVRGASHKYGSYEVPETEESDQTAPVKRNERLHAILNLQKTRARVMEESATSFEQHKRHLLSTTRELVKRKTASAHIRSDALEKGIHKVLEEARSELHLRRARITNENKEFALEMRRKVEKVLAERRRESEAAKGTASNVSSPTKHDTDLSASC